MSDHTSGIERRHRTLTDADVQELARIIQGGVDPAEHAEHHAALRRWIDRENKRADRWEKIRTQVGGWAIISVLGMIGTGAYHIIVLLKDSAK